MGMKYRVGGILFWRSCLYCGLVAIFVFLRVVEIWL